MSARAAPWHSSHLWPPCPWRQRPRRRPRRRGRGRCWRSTSSAPGRRRPARWSGARWSAATGRTRAGASFRTPASSSTLTTRGAWASLPPRGRRCWLGSSGRRQALPRSPSPGRPGGTASQQQLAPRPPSSRHHLQSRQGSRQRLRWCVGLPLREWPCLLSRALPTFGDGALNDVRRFFCCFLTVRLSFRPAPRPSLPQHCSLKLRA
mmetsp:Transcript_10916/g.29060  ORF Transcript_10916/g.29060 Transcript_10916/m.29060 type:complete len:207 (+) Transcript_10916:602-1222(+)